MSEAYIGPCPLDEALAHAEPGPGIRLAISTPNGDWLAVAHHTTTGRSVMIRKCCKLSGQSGSIEGTGHWICDTDETGQWDFAVGCLTWRPL